jgi:hypothetical protein
MFSVEYTSVLTKSNLNGIIKLCIQNENIDNVTEYSRGEIGQ